MGEGGTRMNAIVVVDRNWGIGKGGKLLFSLPTDMKRFRALTTGGTVLMGRKTLDSLPGKKPLPNRRNIVLSSGKLKTRGVETVHTLEELRTAVTSDPTDRVFVIGGGSVYRLLLPLCDRVYLTQAEQAADSPDTWFPNLAELSDWQVERTSDPITENGVTYRFVDYANVRRRKMAQI